MGGMQINRNDSLTASRNTRDIEVLVSLDYEPAIRH